MPAKQEDTLRDVLVVAIGTTSIKVVQSAKEVLGSRYQLEDKYCRVHYLLVDTDDILDLQDHPEYENTYQVRLADERGIENAHSYKEKILAPHLKALQGRHILPAYVTIDLLDHELLSRMETQEANKNPLKGYLYLLANLRRLHKQLAFIKSKMVAPDRSIYVVYSPISGTAAGTWFLITALLFQEFETSSPVLIDLMPSHLKGDEDHNNRNYAVFGWSARLLDVMVRYGVVHKWTIPQLTNPPIEVAVRRREPLYVLLESAYRNQGADHLALDDFFCVMAELLSLAVIGKHNGQGPPSVDSQITNTETDQRMEELKAPGSPTRRFASRGYCAVRYNAKLAKEVARLGVKDALLRYLLGGLPQVTKKSLAEAKEHLTAHVRRKLREFYGEWDDRGYRKTYGESFPSNGVDTAIDEFRQAYSQDLTDSIKNLRGDETGEALFRQQFWEVIKELLDHYGYGLFHHLSDMLSSIQVDDALIIQQIPKLAAKHPTLDAAIAAAQQGMERYRRHISLRKAKMKPEALDRVFHLLLEQAYTQTLLKTLSGEFRALLNEALRYFVVELQRFKQRLENIYDGNLSAYGPHLKKFHQPIGSYLDERTYDLAREKVGKYRRHVDLITRELFQRMGNDLDRNHLGQEELSATIDEVISAQEGIDEFPRDIAEVVRHVASNQNLLRQLLSKGRALTKLQGSGYEKNWCIWHSGKVTPALREALVGLQESINNALSDEAFKVIVNEGPLPLRSKEDVELVLAETILDFPLADVATDQSMEYYWSQDELLFNNGNAASVHRVHTDVVASAPTRRRRLYRDTYTQQERTETDPQGRLEDLLLADVGPAVDSGNQGSDDLSDEELAVVADRLGKDLEAVKSEYELSGKEIKK